MFDAKAFLSTVTGRPGVYCMRDKANRILYVGKAKNLKKRLTSYFRPQSDARIARLVQSIAQIDLTVTYSEKEALLLENSLIKSLKPHYNVIFRDDKSYPYLFLSAHRYPRLLISRGKTNLAGQYFGPYPSAHAIKGALMILQKVFKIRSCDDLYFNNRSRPCLQYQIKRCSAPCVGYISPQAYAQQVKDATLFLQGKELALISNLVQKMEAFADEKAYELAAQLRDQIISLRDVCDQQVVYKQNGNVDVIAACELNGCFCIQLLYIRQGRILDSKPFFPKQTGGDRLEAALRAFIAQFYLGSEDKVDYPHEIVINQNIEDKDLIAETLSQQAKRQIKITYSKRAAKAQWLQLAVENATEALTRRIAQGNVIAQRWQALEKVLNLAKLDRVECFDISHTQGEATVASCVVFAKVGAVKSEYRCYPLPVSSGDDYEAMAKVLARRYDQSKASTRVLPNLVIVDGGKGQLHRAKAVLRDCEMDNIYLMGIAKGQGRKPGLETLYVTRLNDEQEWIVKLPPTSGAFHLLQHIRNEAHRFAITGHRRRRAQTRKKSPLEAIAGVGIKRRQRLLNYFGGQQGLLAASEKTISHVPGISASLAAKIYAALHDK